MRFAELDAVLSLIEKAGADELFTLCADLEELRLRAHAKLFHPTQPQVEDHLLEVDEAAERLSMSVRWLYANKKRLPFTRQQGRSVRFSSRGISEYLAKSRLTLAKRPLRTG
jgi:excisionase family DNA binding protein